MEEQPVPVIVPANVAEFIVIAVAPPVVNKGTVLATPLPDAVTLMGDETPPPPITISPS